MAQRLVFEVEVVSYSVDGVPADGKESREVSVRNMPIFQGCLVDQSSEDRIIPDVLLSRFFEWNGLLFGDRFSNATDQCSSATKNAFHFGDGHFVVISSEMVIKGRIVPSQVGWWRNSLGIQTRSSSMKSDSLSPFKKRA